MSSKPGLALATTVHQPDERLANMIDAHLADLTSHYTVVIARCSPRTHPTILELLRSHGVAAHLGEERVEGIHNIGAVRKEALQLALQAGTDHLQLCDFDRAIHWTATYPQELHAVVTDIPNYDLLVLGRTERAWATHPPYQAETEPLFNRVFALVSGLAWDVGAGSRGLSRRAAETLLQQSQVQTVGTDAEWPLLLLDETSFRSAFRACEGLEFETADRYGPEIEQAGGYAAWEAQVSADPQRWVFRLELALLIAQAAHQHGQRR